MKLDAPKWIWSLATLVLLLAINAIFTPGFFAITVRDGNLFGTLVDILNRATPVALIALGMTLVIGTRGVDLSVGAIAAIAGTLAAVLINQPGANLNSVLLWVLVAGIVLGSINGALVSFFGVQPIVATLILMVCGRGIAQLLGNGQIITFEHPGLVFFGGGHLFGLPFSVTLVAVAFILVGSLCRRTALGLFVESIGDSPTAARFTGIPVRAIVFYAYLLTALLSCLAGLVIAGETKAADANNAGMYIELDAILAVVLGGTSLAGGRFSLFGSIVGALLIQTLTTTILMRGIAPEWTLVLKAILVLSVSLLQSESFRERVRVLRRPRVAA